MGDILAFADQQDGEIRGVALEIVSVAASRAAKLGGSAHALILGGDGTGKDASGLGAYGAEMVWVARDESLTHYIPEVYAPVVAEVARSGNYDAILFPATARGKDLAPRVAALLDTSLASDITRLDVEDGTLVAVRPVYGGKAFARIKFQGFPTVMSLRLNAFGVAESPASGKVQIMTPPVKGAGRSRVIEFQASRGGTMDVSEASIVVSGGRGMRGAEHWTLLEALRDALGSDAALGASRAVVDAGWRPHGEQVGQTGKTVAPKLYFAIGISGAIQHLAGMRTAQTIVAVNKDADAPIFGVADYGIIGDAFEVLPRLTEEISDYCSNG
ncbi:MAG: electron transfer flavoprotein subunit alpha/FixB family protein [Gemmatimonadota bacterium]|nr:electron transfer flavoprotein subunit alpha/FixB family protein [Gemmatimonadota bacterium]